MHLSDDHEPLGERGPELAAPARLRGRDIKTVRAGFIPLVDASVLIACAEFGFAEREGLTLDLVKDVSWANVRDRLAFRQFDVAHMLSPMPVASLLGLGSNPQPAIAPFSLGRGGNAITLSVALYRRMQRSGALRGDEDALSNAQALKHVIDEMRAAGEAMPVFAMTYPYSSHNYELRYWLAAGGIDPDRDVRLVVVPPPLTSDALAAGAIDGFCVGAPWNMVAVEKGVGRIVAVKQDIWASSPEKVIATRPEWAAANAETLSRLIVALDRAARWCDLPTNRLALAETLAAPRYLGASRDILERVLLGQFTIDPDGRGQSPITSSSMPTMRATLSLATRSGSIRRWCAGARRFRTRRTGRRRRRPTGPISTARRSARTPRRHGPTSPSKGSATAMASSTGARSIRRILAVISQASRSAPRSGRVRTRTTHDFPSGASEAAGLLRCTKTRHSERAAAQRTSVPA
jgi:two-component system, oxyanion-binding sensor